MATETVIPQGYLATYNKLRDVAKVWIAQHGCDDLWFDLPPEQITFTGNLNAGGAILLCPRRPGNKAMNFLLHLDANTEQQGTLLQVVTLIRELLPERYMEWTREKQLRILGLANVRKIESN